MGRDDMRAADADRQATAERLRSALAEGRLDLHEYDERLQRAYAARTYGELDRLLTDLPGTVPAAAAQLAPLDPAGMPVVPAPAAGQVRYPGATRRWLVDTWDDYFGVVAVTVGIWAVISAMAGELLYFWPGWVAGPWGVVLLVATVSGLVRDEPQRWAANQERKKAEKAAKRARRKAAAEGDLEGGSGAGEPVD